MDKFRPEKLTHRSLQDVILVHIAKQGSTPRGTLPRFHPCFLFYFHKICPLTTDLSISLSKSLCLLFPPKSLLISNLNN